MVLWDANARFGAEMVNHEVINHERFIVLEHVETANDIDAFIGEMDRFGVEKAVAWHSSMTEYDPDAGTTKSMSSMVGREDRIIPSWMLLPDASDRDYAPEVFFPKMRANNVRLLRATPENNRFFLCEAAMGEQLSIIAEAHIPLYLSPSSGFEYIYSVLKEFPKLTVILYNIGWWPSARYVFPLLRKYENVYFETGDFGMLNGYEETVSRYGSERMLFGTAFPTNNMGGSIYSLMHARISEEERENIAWRNLNRIINEVSL